MKGEIKLAKVADGNLNCLISNHFSTSYSSTLICLAISTCKKS